MRWLVWLAMAGLGVAQERPAAPGPVPAGVPLRVALEHRVAIRHEGDPIRGRLVDSIYVFDRMALAADTLVEGHIAEIGGVPWQRRLKAILSGNFTPARDVRAQFDTLVLADGSRLPLQTSLSRGIAHTVQVTKPGKIAQKKRAILALTAPDKVSRLKSALLGMLPYHRQAWQAGTLFNGVLQEPLAGLPPTAPVPGDHAAAALEPQEVNARLLTPISSATALPGTPIEAVVTQPIFSADRTLLIPEGTHLFGDVVQAQPARRFHRNGKVLFVFRQIQSATGARQGIQGYLESVESDFDTHVAIDAEGATRVSSPRSRFIFPALAVAAAGLSFHQDYDAHGVADQDIAGRAESGAVGLGLIGTLLAQTSRTVASSIAFTGAGFSVYSTFLARGADLILPINTPVTISLRPRGRPEMQGRGSFGGPQVVKWRP